MNPVRQLLRRLDDAGIALNLVEGRLRYRSSSEPPAELLATMKQHREELRSILLRRQALTWPPARRAGEPERQAPLSWGQRQVWATNLFVEDGRYNLSGALRLTGPLDRAAFEAAVTDVHHRHASLRTVFTVQDGVPAQRVLAAAEPGFEFRDLAGAPGAFDTCRHECEGIAARLLPMDHAPPVRSRLYRLAADDHVFAVILHHIVADAVSVPILLDDLARCYNARLDGGRLGPPGDRADMLDFARFEEEFLACADLAPARGHWREVLRDAPLGRLPLPPRLGPIESGPAALPFDLDTGTTADVRRLASASQSTPFMVVAAAIAAMLSRVTGRDDMIIGMPVSRRDRPGLAQLVGLLLDLVPVRLDLRGDPDPRDLIKRVRAAVLGAWSHAAVPLEVALDHRPHPGAPLFSVIITDNGARLGNPSFHQLESSTVDLAAPGAKFDLNFVLRDDLDTLHLDVEFDRRTLDARDVAAMTGMALALLAEAVAHPTRPIRQLCPAAPPPTPPRQLASTAAGDESLTDRLAALARERGDAVAISHAGSVLHYRDLPRRVDLVARGLHQLGLGPGDVVAVALPLGIDLLVAMLGVMGSGAAALMLDDAWPPARAEQLRSDAGADRVVALEADPTSGRIGLTDLVALGATAGPAPPVPAGAAAYVIYTSGSTGRPKGVPVAHQNVLSLINATAGRFRFTGTDTWTLFHSCSFDFSVWEIFGCLLTGGRLVLVPRAVTADPERFADLLTREEVSVLNLTPSALSMLLPTLARCREAVRALRYLIFGGESLDPGLVERWHRDVGGPAQLVNMYGITETTVHASWHWLPPGPQPAEPSIGTALPGTSLYLLDRNGGPVHDRAVGEIYVGGAGVALGYLGQAGQTAQRFLPDPFTSTPGARMYRSGDLGRRNGDTVAYLGRRDSQAQVNGFRVELGEIEAALAGLPGVAAAAAATTTDDSGAFVVAVVVPEPGASLSGTTVVRGARGILPRYMVPAAVAVVPALPLTDNGKLDRAQVILACRSASGGSGRAPTSTPAPPRTRAERLLLEVFREVLHDPAASTETDFFDRGGDSMRAVRLVSLAAERGISLAVRDVYEAPTLADLATRATVDGPPPAPARQPFSLLPPGFTGTFDRAIDDAYPATALQLGMVYLRELAPDSGVYHIVLSYRIGGRLDPAAFRAAAQAVTDRHPILRTSFDLGHPGGPIQCVHTGVVAPVECADLRGLGPDAQANEISQIVARERVTTFDLTRPALFRLVAVARSDQDFQLIFSHHHAILDGWSVNVFFEDLHAWYAHHLSGAPAPPAPPPGAAVADYVALEQAATAEPAHQRFWQSRLLPGAGLLAPERQGPPVMRQVRRELRPGLLAELRTCAAELGVPVKALLLAAHIRAMAWLTGRDEVVTGSVISCRPESPGADRALGLFLNEFPVAVTLREQTWAELARQVHVDELAMLPHRWYPHAMIQHHHGRAPIFDTYFNFTEFHTSRRLVTVAGLDLRDVLELESTHYTLGVNYTVDVRTGELRLILEYDESALARGAVAQAADVHLRLLAVMLSAPGAACRGCPLPEALPADPPLSRAPDPPAPAGGREQSSAGRASLARWESRVRQVWAEVLGQADFDPRTSFFDAGGDSLQAMRVVSRLRASAGELSMAAFMHAPTIAGLAHALHTQATPPKVPPTRLTGSGEPGEYPLTPTQQQLWQLANQLPGLPLFGVPAAVRVDGPLDLDLLRTTFATLVGRHAALRTRIATTGAGPVQIVAPHAELRVDSVDLRAAADPLAQCEELMARAVLEPMDLGRAPLIRAVAYTAADDLHVIYLNLHHAICDGWSMNVLLAEAGEIYRALSTGTAAPALPPAPAGAGAVALAERDWAASAEADAQRQYWIERLAPPWPSVTRAQGGRFGQPAPADLAARLRSATCQLVLPAATVAQMREAARRSSLTDFMLLLTAFAATLHAWSGQTDVRVATMTANRLQPDRESVVGLLANTVVLRLRAGADPARLSEHVKQVCLEAYERQRLPFEDVLASLSARSNPPQEAGQLFEVMLLLQDENVALDPQQGMRWRPYAPRRGPLAPPVTATTCDFVLAARPVDGELALTLQYRPAVTEAAVARSLLADVAVTVDATARTLRDLR